MRVPRPRAPPGGRRKDLRGRADPGRRTGAAAQGDLALVPVRRDADALHLDGEHARVHPAAAVRRDVPPHPGLGDLRRDDVDLGDARARAAHVRLHALRGDPLERPGQVLQELDPGGAEGDPAADHPARDPRPVHAAHLAEHPTLREHARRAHADPHVHRADVRAARTSTSRSSSSPRRPPSTSSRSSSSSRSRPSSSLLCPPSTSARRSSRNTRRDTTCFNRHRRDDRAT